MMMIVAADVVLVTAALTGHPPLITASAHLAALPFLRLGQSNNQAAHSMAQWWKWQNLASLRDPEP